MSSTHSVRNGPGKKRRGSKKPERRLGRLHARWRSGIATDYEAQIFGEAIVGYYVANAARWSVGLAEREGFEPPIRLPVFRISSAARSTTLPPLRGRKGKQARSVAAMYPTPPDETRAGRQSIDELIDGGARPLDLPGTTRVRRAADLSCPGRAQRDPGPRGDTTDRGRQPCCASRVVALGPGSRSVRLRLSALGRDTRARLPLLKRLAKKMDPRVKPAGDARERVSAEVNANGNRASARRRSRRASR